MYNYPTGMYIFFYKKQHSCYFPLIPAQPQYIHYLSQKKQKLELTTPTLNLIFKDVS